MSCGARHKYGDLQNFVWFPAPVRWTVSPLMSPFGNPLLRPPLKTGIRAWLSLAAWPCLQRFAFRNRNHAGCPSSFSIRQRGKVSLKFSLFRACRVNQANRKQTRTRLPPLQTLQEFRTRAWTLQFRQLACAEYKGRKSSPPSAANDCFPRVSTIASFWAGAALRDVRPASPDSAL
jgi:hypothetical protein